MPPQKNPEVDEYIAQQPEQVQPALRELRAMIRAAFPNASEAMYLSSVKSSQAKTDFPVYKIGEEMVISFAGRSVGARLYIDADIVEKYSDQLGALRQRNVCVLYKPNKSLDADTLRELFRTMINEAAAKRK
jgi:uncharacterized protein YdhG (YjbR/CyaY superfamily)